MSERILILGASARAAAHSAARAGLLPWAGDLFADADLTRLCPAIRVVRYPCDFYATARRASAGPWLYTGGLENYPRVVERIAAERPLYGNSAGSLRRVRDPAMVAAVAAAVGLPFPKMARSADSLPRDSSWIRKGTRSSGGTRVEAWNEKNEAPAEMRGWYFQQRVIGQSCGATFVAAKRSARLLGVTQQLVGGDGEIGDLAGARLFHYAGSIGPIYLDPADQRKLELLGDALSAEFGLVGLFGIDFVLDRENIWPIEVNPRYTASVEVLERALGFRAVGLHVTACRDHALPDVHRPATGKIAGKAVFFAREALTLSESSRQLLDADSQRRPLPLAADIPAVAGEFSAGSPVVTLLTDGAETADVEAELSRRLTMLRSDLEGQPRSSQPSTAAL